MDPPKYLPRPNPITKASFLSRTFFSWVTSLINKGNKRELEDSDLYDPLEGETVTQCHGRLNREWKGELLKLGKGGKPSFRWALIRAYGQFYAVTGILSFIEEILSVIKPVLFGHLMGYFASPPSITSLQAYCIVLALCCSLMLYVPINVMLIDRYCRSAIQWQIGPGSLIYRKMCRLSDSALQGTNTGHILNLITNDLPAIASVYMEYSVTKISHVQYKALFAGSVQLSVTISEDEKSWSLKLTWELHSLWLGPLEGGIVLWIVYQEIGASVFVGFVLVALLVPLELLLGRLASQYRVASLKYTDERVGIMSEIVSGMRAIKMYCWEKPFGSIVHRFRKHELNYTWRSRFVSDLFREIGLYQSKLLTAVVIVVFVWTNHSTALSPVKIFPMMAYFFIINNCLIEKLPWSFKRILQVGVSIDRIQDFLLLPERETGQSNEDLDLVKSTEISMKNVSVRRSEVGTDVLRNVSFDIGIAELLVVIGPVGCGKSTLLSVLLGEVPTCQGSVITRGSVGYVPQEPWVFSSTIRQNILFGETFDANRFAEVVRVCELEKDLESLPLGENTRVGEKGVTLSGGQKARVNLARALYMDAAFYLLDDPLSAVDVHTGKRIFEKCINGFLQHKPRILVTHQLQYLERADKIMMLHKGSVKAYGTYKELVESGIDLAKSVSQLAPSADDQKETNIKYDKKDADYQISGDLGEDVANMESFGEEYSDDDILYTNSKTYRNFLRAGSSWKQLSVLMGFCIFTQICYNGCDWWLMIWSREEEIQKDVKENARSDTLASTNKNAIIYIVLLSVTLLVAFCKNIFFSLAMASSARHLHHSLYDSVVRAPIRFFDTTKTGLIMSRFSKDLSRIDDDVPERMYDATMKGLVVIGNTLVVLITNPILIIPAVPMAFALAKYRRLYITAQAPASQLFYKVLNPVISHFTSTIQGLRVIRSRKAEEICIRDIDELFDHYSGNFYTNNCLYNWFCVRTNFVACLFSAVTIIGCLFWKKYLDPSSVGLIISTTVPLLWYVLTVSRLISELDVALISVNRVQQFSRLPPEGAEITSYRPPPSRWPHSGNIIFENVSFSYSPQSSEVLHNLNFRINAQEKIGIVGRTGAGKSSLVQALFRMAEPTGRIIIDGVDCTKLGLWELRRHLCIIPQDPVLFRRSLRMNLDPFKEYSDKHIWTALEQVQLRQTVEALPNGLEHMVTEAGGNFSVGQRQLICLARAILRQQKILILDEATANVDKGTDEIIQSTIKSRFVDCTVLTIAHRLNTIMDSDRVMVIQNGRIVEFDNPRTLQNNTGSLFSLMLKQANSS